MSRALILSGGGGRGMFQVGVLKYLEEAGWKPDLICGTSVGACNAVLIGSGLQSDQLALFWNVFVRERPYKFKPLQFIMRWLLRKQFDPMPEEQYFKAKLTKQMDIDALRRSETKVIITAVNILRSRLEYFDNSTISIDHVLASMALPLIFPWQFINEEPYWDGGVMANVPIMPALEYGAEEIIVVLLSPIDMVSPSPPQNLKQVGEFVFEQLLKASYYNVLGTNLHSKIATVAPTNRLGLGSVLEFSAKTVKKFIQEGYYNAGKQLNLMKENSMDREVDSGHVTE